jgi:hypothetical protein
MEFRYPRRLPHLLLALAASGLFSLLFLAEPGSDARMSRGVAVAMAVSGTLLGSLYTSRFAVRVDAVHLSVFSWSTRRFLISEIVDVQESTPNPFFGAFTGIATIRLTDSRRIVLLSYLEGFDDLVGLLRRRAKHNGLA